MILPPRDRGASRRLTPGWTPFATFATEHASLGRDAFLTRVRAAHLLLWTPLVADAAEETFTTIRARPDQERAAALTRRVTTGGADFAAGRLPTPWGVGAVEKRPGSNPFALMITLGRAPNNDLVLNHAALSKFHAYLRRSGESWVVDDPGSTNGTCVDGVPVESGRGVPARSGARITLGGEVELELLAPDDLWARLLH